MVEQVNCYNCKKRIISKDDANVLAYLGFVARVFCNDCHASKGKAISTQFLYVIYPPINSRSYLFGILLFTIFILLYFVLLFVPAIISSEPIHFSWFFILPFLALSTIWSWTLYFIAKKKVSLI